jgi:histone-lysine N-methyltransferase SETD2
MNALRVVFPTTKNLICVWHINKNILANVRRHFPSATDDNEEAWKEFMGFWSNVTEATTEDGFELSWDLLSRKYSREHSSAVLYISNTWLVHKERFVRAFTDRYLHMGSRCSSRVESSHSAMKRYVNLAKCDLLTCKERLDVLLETQFTELQAEIETDKLKVVHSYRIPIFRGLQN